MIQAQLPDGTVLEFPDGTSDEIINRTVQQQLGVPQTSRVAREIIGGVAGLGEGLGRFTRGAIQTVADVGAAAGLPTEGIREAVAREQAAQEQKFKQDFGDAVAPRVGQVIGETLPAIAIPASRAASLGGQALAGATGGAIASALQPQSELQTPEEALSQRGEQAAVGGLIGGIATPAASAALGGGSRAVRSLLSRPKSESTVAPLLGDVSGGLDDASRISQTREILGSEAEKLNRRVSDAFKRATEGGRNASVQNVDTLSQRLARKAVDTIDDEQRAIYQNAANRISELGDTVTVNDLQGLRRAATQASTGGGSRGFASGDVKRTVDEFLDEALEAGEIVGDAQAVRQWKNAINLRKEFGQKFEAPRVVSRAIDEGETAERIGQQLFGGGSVSNAKDAAKNFDSVVRAAGDNANEAQSLLKQSIVHKMFNQASGRSGDVGEPQVWARGLANEIQKLRTRNASLFKKFTKAEQAQLNNLEKQLRKAEEGAAVNKALDFAFGIINRNPLINVQLPTPFAPQANIGIDDAINLIGLNPRTDNIPEAIRLISGTAGAAAGVEASQ